MRQILLFTIISSKWSIILAVVITTFDANQLENIYIQRKFSGAEDPFVHLDDENKEQQCAEVLGSRYFRDILKREYADKNEQEVKDYVQTQGKLYVNVHYKVAEDSKTLMPTYPYSLFSVQTKQRGIHQQLMFPCLSRHSTTKRIKDYFISYAFMENERFLYGLSDQKASLEVQALIEIAPPAWSSDDVDNIESFYLEKSGDAAKKTALKDDQLCTLNEPNKRRLCSLVFDSRVYVEYYAFHDSASNINCQCKKKGIKFEKVSRKRKSRAYVSVFKCFVKRLQSPFVTEVRYLANGFHENSVFVMKPSGRYVVFETYVSAVSVLAENSVPEIHERAECKNALKLITSIPRCIYQSFSFIIDKLGK